MDRVVGIQKQERTIKILLYTTDLDNSRPAEGRPRPKVTISAWASRLQPVFLNSQSILSEMVFWVLHWLLAASFSKFAIKCVRKDIEGT